MPPLSKPSLQTLTSEVIQAGEQWPAVFVQAVSQRLAGHPAVALLRREEATLAPLAATTSVAPLAATLLDALPQRVGDALLLPIPSAPDCALWVQSDASERQLRARLKGWLDVAGLALDRDRQAEEMARQRAARDHFFSMVNHDLKSPLASIKAMADLLVRKVGRGTLNPKTEAGREELLERLTFLSHRARDMALLIDEIGDVSSIERGRLSLNRQASNLASLIRDALERLERRREGRTVHLESGDEPLVSEVDPHRVAQVFYNLLKNALDYSAPGSAVTVRLAARDGCAIVEIEDQGRGIAPEQAQRLFKEYGRVVQEAPSGLGIGLYVASALVEAHGGALSLNSEPGRGTTVRLALPLAER